MTQRHQDDAEREPDIVLEMLTRVRLRVPGLTDDAAREVEQELRAKFGGMRFRVPKRKKHPSAEQRRKIFEAALTNAPTEQVTAEGGIHRSTLYRLLKRGGS